MSRKQRNKHYGSDNGSSTLLSIANSSKCNDNNNSGSGFPEHLLRHINCGHHPHQATAELQVETLIPNAVFVARNALSSKECREWINYAENNNAWDVVSHPATKSIAHRE
jgi:hypothetical protein